MLALKHNRQGDLSSTQHCIIDNLIIICQLLTRIPNFFLKINAVLMKITDI